MKIKINFVLIALIFLAACNQSVIIPSNNSNPFSPAAINGSEVTKLFPSNPERFDYFGTSVAVEGNLAAVGYLGYDATYIDERNGNVEKITRDAGAVIVYEKNSQGQWQQQALLEQDTSDGDFYSNNDSFRISSQFGERVAISGDTIFVATDFRRLLIPQGQSYYGLPPGDYRGLVYIFKKIAGSWTQVDILAHTQLPNNITVGAFGSALDVEGSTLVVGASSAQQRDPTTPTVNGGVFIYEEDANGNWNLSDSLFVAEADATYVAPLPFIGRSVALDGNSLVVGGVHAAYVFNKTQSGWTLEKELRSEALIALGQTRSNPFGEHVAISGNTIAVSSRSDVIDSLVNTGAVYIFERQNSIWADTPIKLEPNDPTTNNYFGRALNLSGNALIVGASSARHSPGGSMTFSSGAIYVYEKDTTDLWVQQSKIVPSDFTVGQQFGYSLARDGRDLFVGARTDDVDRSDGVGIQTGSAYILDIVIDSSPPSITANLTGTLGKNDWYTSDVDLNWAIQDGESEWVIDAGCTAVSIIEDTDVATHPNGESFSCEASSVGGTESSSTVVKRDTAAPVVTITGVTDGDRFELGNEPAPECTTTDATSGVAAEATMDIVPAETNPGDGTGNFTVSCNGAEDNAGNTNTESLIYTITAPADSTPPEIRYEITGTLGNDDWYTSDVSLSWTVTDNESAVTSSGCESVTLTSDTLEQSFTCEATSEGGTSSETVTLKRDASSPNVTATPDAPANANGWHNADVTVSYSCDDATAGVDSSASDLSADGLTVTGSASATCVDLAGNSVSASYSAQIDKGNPAISASVNPAANSAGWHNTAVTFSFSCTDNESGIDQDTVSGSPVSLSSEGANQSVSSSGSCIDLAGNSAETVTQSGINIDLTAPNISVVGVSDGATYQQGSEPSPACDTQDALSGVDVVASLSTAGGPTGLVTASCSGASDNAGNVSQSVSVSYAIEASSSYDFGGFYRPVRNAPAMNVAKAGRTIPIKFSLGGDFGLNILGNGYPSSRRVNCRSKAALTSYEPTQSQRGLRYATFNDRYSYTWKTVRSWRGTCREFTLRLDDGTEASAYFRFR